MPPGPEPSAEAADSPEWADASLVFERIIGEGGMGTVYAVREVALQRDIAVKQLRADRTDPRHIQALLGEARITSAVSHPSVVPVHDVRLGPDGVPSILLKHVEGRPWSRLLRDPAAVRTEHGHADPLPFHIGVLIRVCAAIHAAHARNIVHRDLKPGNIMVGPTGEVYVLDWGLSATLDPDADERLPRLPEERGAGTPEYMAPEMVSARYGEIGPWTDVYLLGGLLFQVLWGRPPHDGANALNMVIDACRTGVDIPEDGPPELVALARRCLERVPAARIQDAETVRRALVTWLDHRASVDRTDQARSEEARLDAWLDRTGPAEMGVPLHQRFGAAVFGYTRALEGWPDNPEALAGLERTVRKVVEHALAAEADSVATAALGYLRSPPPDLQARVDATLTRRQVQAARQARWQALGVWNANHREHIDSTRTWLLGSGFALVTVSSATALIGSALGGLQTSHLLTAALIGLLAVLTAMGRGIVRPGGLSGLDQRIAGHLLFYAVVRVIGLAAALVWEAPPATAIPLELGLTMLLLTLQAIAFDARMRIVAAIAALSAVIGLALPIAAPALLVVTYAAMSILLLLADLRTRFGADDRPEPPPETIEAPNRSFRERYGIDP